MQTHSLGRRLWWRFTEPAAYVEGDERQRVRLLTIMALALLLIAPLLILGWVLTSPTFAAVPLITGGLYVALVVVYALSRTRHHRLSAYLLIGSLLAMSAATVIVAPGPMHERMLALQLLPVAIMLASLLLSIRATLLLAALCIAGTLGFLRVPEAPISVTYGYLVYEIVFSALLVTASSLRNAQVAARRQAEAALLASEARYRSLVDRNGVGIWQVDPAGLTEYINPAMCALLGLAGPGQLIGQTFDQFFTPESLPGHSTAPGQGEAVAGHEVELIRADGERRNMIVYDAPLFADDGSLRSVIGTFVDITERRRALDALHASEQRFRSLTLQAPDTIYILNLGSGEIEFINRDSFLGYSLDELRQPGSLFAQLDPADRARLAETWQQLRAHGTNSVTIDDYRIRSKSGAWEWLQQRAIVLSRTPAGSPAQILVVLTVVTERRRLEEQILQAQKMEAIGRLAGGVAHDFNNLLTVMNGYADVLLATMPEDDPGRGDVAEIAAAGRRAAVLTRQLLTFSRQSMREVEAVSLNAAVREAETMLRRVIGEDVALEVQLSPRDWYVHADPDQLGQILLNLALNARDAMPRGGRLTIITCDEPVTLPGPAGAAPGQCALLVVSDTGHGMTPEVRARVFEPFFTTKGLGGGTGLGLAVVHGIVTQSGGTIEIESEPDHGATFRVALPIIAAQAPQAAAPAPSQVALGGSETILLVEDDAAVRQLTERGLASRGYRVLAVASAAEAMRLVAAGPGQIDLVLTDVVMPGQSGPELVAALRHDAPQLRAIFMSGYAPDTIVRHGMVEGAQAFIAKPFTPNALARRVREMLDQKH